LGGNLPYADTPDNRLTSSTVRKHDAWHAKATEAATSQGVRGGEFALQRLRRLAALGMYNVAITMYTGIKSGMSFRQIEDVCRNLLPCLKASVDLSKVAMTEQAAAR
jgi:hypothetical protein